MFRHEIGVHAGNALRFENHTNLFKKNDMGSQKALSDALQRGKERLTWIRAILKKDRLKRSISESKIIQDSLLLTNQEDFTFSIFRKDDGYLVGDQYTDAGHEAKILNKELVYRKQELPL